MKNFLILIISLITLAGCQNNENETAIAVNPEPELDYSWVSDTADYMKANDEAYKACQKTNDEAYRACIKTNDEAYRQCIDENNQAYEAYLDANDKVFDKYLSELIIIEDKLKAEDPKAFNMYLEKRKNPMTTPQEVIDYLPKSVAAKSFGQNLLLIDAIKFKGYQASDEIKQEKYRKSEELKQTKYRQAADIKQQKYRQADELKHKKYVSILENYNSRLAR